MRPYSTSLQFTACLASAVALLMLTTIGRPPQPDSEHFRFDGEGQVRHNFELRDDEQLESDIRSAAKEPAPLVLDFFAANVHGKLSSLQGHRTLEAMLLSGSTANDGDLQQLGSLQNLRVLHIDSTGITPTGLLQLRSARGLESLMVSEMPIDATALARIVRRWPRLKSLGLEKTPIPPGGFTALAKLRHLEYLNLSRTAVTDDDFQWIAALPQLKTLHINQTNLTDEGLRQIGKIQSLEKLDINMTKVSDEGLRHLRPLKNLQSLYFAGTNVTPAGLEQLAPLPSLRLVGISWNETPESRELMRHHLPLARRP